MFSHTSYLCLVYALYPLCLLTHPSEGLPPSEKPFLTLSPQTEVGTPPFGPIALCLLLQHLAYHYYCLLPQSSSPPWASWRQKYRSSIFVLSPGDSTVSDIKWVFGNFKFHPVRVSVITDVYELISTIFFCFLFIFASLVLHFIKLTVFSLFSFVQFGSLSFVSILLVRTLKILT